MSLTITKPTVNGSTGTWGTVLNQALDDIVSQVNTNLTNIATNTTNISSLTTRMGTAESNITALQSGGSGITSASFTTQRDLLVGTGNGTYSRLGGPSAAGQGLVYGTGTTGLQWSNVVGQAATATAAGVPAAYSGGVVYVTDTNRYLAYSSQASGTWVPLPGAIVAKFRQTTAQSIADGTATNITWQTIDYDRMSSMSASANTYTPGIAGWYELCGGFSFAVNTTGRREAYWAVSGTAQTGSNVTVQPVGSVYTATACKSYAVLLTATDTVALVVTQNSGGALSTYASGSGQSYMTVKYLGAA